MKKLLLRNREVFATVIEFVLDTPNGRRSVSRLARTCRALSEPCLNALWKELDSLLPLLSLLPNDLFKRPRRPGLGFAKNPSQGDWKRLLLYGERVQKITYNETVGNVSASIFTVIEDCKPQEYILPNLQTLVWRVDTREGLQRSLLFLTPQLRNIVAEVGPVESDALKDFLVAVASHTLLYSLSITSPTKVPDDLPNIMSKQSSLERVILMTPSVITPPVGRWLSSLQGLKSLQVDVADRSDSTVSTFFNRTPRSILSPGSSSRSSSGNSSPSPSKIDGSMVIVDMRAFEQFPYLQHVNITGDITTVTTFLSNLNSPLQSIELALDEPKKEKEWRNLWSTISHQFGHTLRSLCVSASGASRFQDLIRATARGENSARRLSLYGLQDLHQLIRLELDLPESKVFLNEDLKHLSAACPNLEVAKLCPLSRWPQNHGAPKTTLVGLVPLVSKCRRLHTLQMPLNATGTSDDNIFNLAFSSSSLVRLHVGHSWISDSLQAAILLSHLAPRLESLKWFHERNRPGYIEANNVAWQKVSEILPQLQRLRMHERNQAQVVISQALSPQIQPRSITPPPPPPPPIPRPRFDSPKVAKESKCIQTDSVVKKNFSMQAQPTLRHKSVSVRAVLCHTSVDATPCTVDSEVDAVPIVQDEGVDARPTMVEQAIETETPLPLVVVEPQPVPMGRLEYMGSLVYQAIRAISPPILMRILDVFTSVVDSKGDSNDMMVPMRTMMLNEKISPVCQ